VPVPYRRLLRGCTVAGLTLLLTALPATAATGDPARYRSSVSVPVPAVDGLTVTVSPDGGSVTLTNGSGLPVVVRGYAGEDYLRISDRGVEENTASVTSVLNRGEGLAAVAGRRDAPAVWFRRAAGNRATWSDLRVRWTAPERPPIVLADPARPARVVEWAIPLQVGGTEVLVRGRVDWLGADGSGWTWRRGALVLGLLLAAGALGAAMVRSARRPPVRRAAGVSGPGGAAPGDGRLLDLEPWSGPPDPAEPPFPVPAASRVARR
jgi:hypothetical protein